MRPKKLALDQGDAKNGGRHLPFSPPMKLDAAKSLVTDSLQQMNALYHGTVFDEWVVISFQAGRGVILAYSGPRAESYKQRFAADIIPLRSEMAGRRLAAGDFDFVPVATGTHFDACLCVGRASYLICNNTAKSMAEIRQSPDWLQAQGPFAELSEKFRADPLE